MRSDRFADTLSVISAALLIASLLFDHGWGVVAMSAAFVLALGSYLLRRRSPRSPSASVLTRADGE